MILSIFLFLILEYIGDFLLQDREMAINKSSDIRELITHVATIVVILNLVGVVGIFLDKTEIAILIPVGVLYGIFHAIQDWYIWRLYKYIRRNEDKNFKYYEDKLFYDFIGLDRLLHIITGITLIGVFL